MAPIFAAQAQRLDEQATAQKLMSRELETLRTGFSSIQNLFQNQTDNLSPDASNADETRIPLLLPANSSATNPSHPSVFPFPPMNPETHHEESPYSSPHHHLLHLHESLRDEVARITSTLSDLEGRNSMERLNDNLRIRDEMAYLGARVEGLGRQVQWLTSAQLMRRQQGSGRGEGGGEAGGVGEVVSAVGEVMRGVRGVVGGGAGSEGSGEGPVAQGRAAPMRRGASEEGRTKL
ncbi:hypothetical protein MBLNU230_g2333t1 [Neophaeotheca triangularis]